jgi:hypothetical protein
MARIFQEPDIMITDSVNGIGKAGWEVHEW